jgi:hypothetical protein
MRPAMKTRRTIGTGGEALSDAFGHPIKSKGGPVWSVFRGCSSEPPAARSRAGKALAVMSSAKLTTNFGLATILAALWMVAIPFAGAAAARVGHQISAARAARHSRVRRLGSEEKAAVYRSLLIVGAVVAHGLETILCGTFASSPGPGRDGPAP